jgi:hypothetical protein
MLGCLRYEMAVSDSTRRVSRVQMRACHIQALGVVELGDGVLHRQSCASYSCCSRPLRGYLVANAACCGAAGDGGAAWIGYVTAS